jgi:hypothetical protein
VYPQIRVDSTCQTVQTGRILILSETGLYCPVTAQIPITRKIGRKRYASNSRPRHAHAQATAREREPRLDLCKMPPIGDARPAGSRKSTARRVNLRNFCGSLGTLPQLYLEHYGPRGLFLTVYISARATTPRYECSPATHESRLSPDARHRDQAQLQLSHEYRSELCLDAHNRSTTHPPDHLLRRSRSSAQAALHRDVKPRADPFARVLPSSGRLGEIRVVATLCPDDPSHGRVALESLDTLVGHRENTRYALVRNCDRLLMSGMSDSW